ncbi:hypothetical protein D3C78_1223910 [compost metagenome]
MIVDGGGVAVLRHHQHARHQPQQLWQLTGAAGADQLAVDHADAARHRRRCLLQASGGEDFGQIGSAGEEVCGKYLAGHQHAGQQRQCGAYAANHGSIP